MLNIPKWQEERISATWKQSPHGEGSSLFCASNFISLILPCGEQAVLCASFPSLISSIWHYHICYISSSQCWHERTFPRVVNRIKSRKLAKTQNVILHDSFLSSRNTSSAVSWSSEDSKGDRTPPCFVNIYLSGGCKLQSSILALLAITSGQISMEKWKIDEPLFYKGGCWEHISFQCECACKGGCAGVAEVEEL